MHHDFIDLLTTNETPYWMLILLTEANTKMHKSYDAVG